VPPPSLGRSRPVARAQLAANAEQGTEVVQAQAQVALAGSATAAAQARLAQAVLTAPADARVLARLVEPGQIVQPGHALLSLALAGPLQLVAQVDERYLEQLQVGQTASVLADAFPEPALQRARAVDLAAGRRAARRDRGQVLAAAGPAGVPARRHDAVGGGRDGRRQAALVVPVDALRGDQAAADAVVLVARDGRVEERPVRVGLRTLEAAEVLEGLSAGETVLRGSTLRPGSRVRAAIDDDLPAAALPGCATARVKMPARR
jgi:HlyD family secretion protein